MKDADHLALASRLCSTYVPNASALWKTLFFSGNLLPDYNPATYLRDFSASRKPLGHNDPHSRHILQKIQNRLAKEGISSLSGAYRLGCAVHYLADGFTFVHTPAFRGNMAEHKRYEKALHQCFPSALESFEMPTVPLPINELQTYLQRERNVYQSDFSTPTRDSNCILRVCSLFFLSFSVADC